MAFLGGDFKFAIILGCSCVISTPYSIPVAFLPPMAKKVGLDEAQIGIMLGSYAVGVFFTSIWAGKNMQYLDKKKTLLYSMALIVCGLILFSLVVVITNPLVFEVLGLIARLIQGISVALTACILYSLIPKYYPETLQKKLALMEFSSGVAVGMGPLLGSFFAYLGGFTVAFLSVGGIIVIFMWALIKWDIFQELGESVIGEQAKEVDNNKEGEKINSDDDKITYGALFKNARMVLTFALITVIATSFTIYSPVFSIFVSEKYDIDHRGTAILLALVLLFYSLPTFFTDQILSSKYDRRTYLVLGYVCQSLGLIWVAGSFFFGQHFGLLVLGMCLLGFGTFCSNLPGMPEFIDIMKLIKPGESSDVINDYASGSFNGLWGLAEFIGPVLGGILTNNYDFATAIEIYSYLIWIILLAYLTIGEGFKGLRISYDNYFHREETKTPLKEGEGEA